MTAIPLRHGATWTVLTVIYAVLAGFCVFAAVEYPAEHQALLAVAGAVAAAMGAAAISLLFLAGARRAPTLTIVADGVVVDVPGVLRRAFLIPHPQIRHVYMRDSDDIKNDRPRGGDWFRRRDVPAGSWKVPSLAFGGLTSPSEWRLLLILDPPIVFKPLVRRTAGVRAVAAGITKLPTYLPSYRTVARGLACEPDHLQEAVDALFAAGYPVTRPPVSPDHVRWLQRGDR